MKKPNRLYQLKSAKLWKDSIAIGLAIFGVLSAFLGVFLPSLNEIFNSIIEGALATIGIIFVCYLIAVFYQWWNVRSSITKKVRGIKVTIRQGNIFDETDGWKVIGVDDTFSTSSDDSVISHTSLHGKLIQKLIKENEIQNFQDAVSVGDGRNDIQLGSARTYKDYILLVMTKLNHDNEAHTDNQKFEGTLRKMWTEISRLYSGKPIYLPLLGDGVIRFDGVSEKPSPSALLKCIICTLRTSSVQLKAPVTILIYDRMNEINFYDLQGL